MPPGRSWTGKGAEMWKSSRAEAEQRLTGEPRAQVGGNRKYDIHTGYVCLKRASWPGTQVLVKALVSMGLTRGGVEASC